MMRVCEVCGSEEELKVEGNEPVQTRMLHVCNSCITDRAFHSVQEEELS
jgi:hypothetical protein